MTVKMQMQPLPLTDVKIDSPFWTPRQETNRTVTLRHEYELIKKNGNLEAYQWDWWDQSKGAPPWRIWVGDMGKWIEACGYALTGTPDPALQELVEHGISCMLKGQKEDGYLYPNALPAGKRWSNLKDQHEFYEIGHDIEGAVAYYQATGRRQFLDAICRAVDLMEANFGIEPGKKRGYDGHEEIELGLAKLYRATGNEKYLKLCKFFVDERGNTNPHYFDVEAATREPQAGIHQGEYAYYQAHKPLREQDEVVRHAVRSMYICTGMADVAALTGDDALLRACRKLWDSATLHKMYVTGGVGSTGHGEAFTGNYDLPNQSAYAETCAAIGLVFFAHRMVQLEADSKYADVLERSLYNGSLSGISMDGKKFFYVNPISSSGNHHRSEWFGCACCPPNIARLIAGVGQYAYSSSASALYVHQYVGSTAKANVAGAAVTLTAKTEYPWDGTIDFTLECSTGILPVSEEDRKDMGKDAHATKNSEDMGKMPMLQVKFDLMLRIPAWCGMYKLAVNGKAVKAPVVKGYAKLHRAWQSGDTVQLVLDMPVQRVAANPQVSEAAGKIALQRGPILFCLEQTDNAAPVGSLLLPDKAKLTARFDKKFLGGAAVIEGAALAPDAKPWKKNLYQPVPKTKLKTVKFKAIPYALWDNRDPGAMVVWLPRA